MVLWVFGAGSPETFGCSGFLVQGDPKPVTQKMLSERMIVQGTSATMATIDSRSMNSAVANPKGGSRVGAALSECPAGRLYTATVQIVCNAPYCHTAAQPSYKLLHSQNLKEG